MPKDLNKKPKKKRKITRKQIITALIVFGVLVVAVVFGLLVRWLQDQAQRGHDAEIIGLLDNPLPQDVTEAQNLASQGNYDEAGRVIDESLKSADSDTKYELYMQQAINYENQQNNDKALESYRNAETIKQTFAVYQAMGRVYETMGNVPLALENYKKALTMVDPNDPAANMDKRLLEEKIKGLGG